MVEYLYPKLPAEQPLGEVLAERCGNLARPFQDDIIEFLNAVSRRLFAVARTEPALAPLAFFLRKANLAALAEQASSRAPRRAVIVPQGTVFHVPPTNVDTLFLYTLAISMLAGNSNIVRISRNAGPATDQVLSHLLATLDDFPQVGAGLTIVRYGHEADLLELCSQAADVRMVWGGDGAIQAIRRSPLRPRAKELTFPDRVSLAAISADAWLTAAPAERQRVIEGLYNDVYWFDQMACSSPAQLILVGTPAEAEQAAAQIATELAAVADQRYQAVDGQAINKMVSLLSALDGGLRRFNWVSNSLVTIEADDLAAAESYRPGGGFVSVQQVTGLDELIGQLDRRVQTLSTFGFSTEQLREFAIAANGRGIDRIVEIGHALDFDAVWDGKDLLAESVRLVTLG